MIAICEICQSEYQTYPSWVELRKTCSRTCMGRLKSLENLGEKNPFYGKRHSDLAKCQISMNRKGKGKMFGKFNPAYGKPSWNSGLKVTTNTGKTHFIKGMTPWNKNKEFEAIRGENNVNWRGGVTPIHEMLRRSAKYKMWRTAVFERDDYTCQHCNERGGQLEADHIKQFAYYPELRFDVDNGRTLCKGCHRKTSTWGNQYRDSLGRFTLKELTNG